MSIELAIVANAGALPALNKIFIAPLKKAGFEAAAALFDLGHVAPFAYTGSAATFIPGYLFVQGTRDVAKAWNRYNVDLMHCAGAVPTS